MITPFASTTIGCRNPKLTNARSYLIYGNLENLARISGVGYGLLDRPHLDVHAACRRPAGHPELTILLTNFGALSLANLSRGPTRFKKLSGRTQGPIWDSRWAKPPRRRFRRDDALVASQSVSLIT